MKLRIRLVASGYYTLQKRDFFFWHDVSGHQAHDRDVNVVKIFANRLLTTKIIYPTKFGFIVADREDVL